MSDEYKDKSVVFMGTPRLSRQCLEQLIKDGINITGVFTRADKRVGRKYVMTPPPVKVTALRNGIPVWQPRTLRGEATDILRMLSPDMIIVVAYGRILPQEVIDIPEYGCINLHVSLLPKYRGAAPIQWAIINGETETGVSVMFIDRGLDTGDVIDTLRVEIGENENRQELSEKVRKLGKSFLSETVKKIFAGDYSRTPQNNREATYAPPLTKDMASFTFLMPAAAIHNKIRGQYPWPGTSFVFDGKTVKVTGSLVCDKSGDPGEILRLNPLTVACSEKSIILTSLSPRGSKAMTGTAWAAGKRLKKGDSLF